jgi:hypothetical protein
MGQLYTLQARGLNSGEKTSCRWLQRQLRGRRLHPALLTLPQHSATLQIAASCSLQQVRYTKAFASWFAKAIGAGAVL